MTSARRGNVTSDTEVTNVSAHGFWVLVGERELFVSFESFPFFRDASIAHILNVEHPGLDHLHWPDLDVDLSIASIEDAARVPLISRVQSKPTI